MPCAVQVDKWATFNRDFGRNLDLVQSRLKQWEEVMSNIKATGKQPSQAMLQQQSEMQAYAAHLMEESGGQRRVGTQGGRACCTWSADSQRLPGCLYAVAGSVNREK